MKNYQLTISNEQLAMSEVSKRSDLSKRSARKQRHCSFLLALLFLLFSFFSLLSSCDLFTGPKVNMYKEVSDIVDWSNAPKLNVRIDYPPEWGTSNPPRGDITPARDLRKGYEFSVEFTVTPGSLYAVKSWQVFYTSDLYDSELGNWLEDTSLVTQVTPLDENEVTYTTVDNKTFKFIINTTEPVTIVPWCEISTRITKTTPHNRLDPPVSRASSIVIYFNGALNTDTVKFADVENGDGIWITSNDGTVETPNKAGDRYLWYYPPVYTVANGFFMIIMDVKTTLPPAGSLMTVKVKGIKDPDGVEMNGVYSFSWTTRDRSDVSTWSAEYKHDADNNSGPIEVKYSIANANTYGVEAYYRLDKGAKIKCTINNDVPIPYYSINNVSGPDYSGIREGRQASGIREYEIFIELNKDGKVADFTSFKIWNIPGMKVSNDNPVVEVRTEEDLIDMKDNLSGQYVLANDISVSNDDATNITVWTPVGASETTPFTGNFYGVGHKITFSRQSSIGGTTYRGLFGYVQGQGEVIEDGKTKIKNALICDLTFEYNGSAISHLSSPSYIGGVVGYLKNTTVRNVITLGDTFDINTSEYGNVSFGGITGYIEGSGKIENCRAALSTSYISNGNTENVYIGAIAGETGTGSEANTITIKNGYTFGDNRTLGPEVTITRLLIDRVTVAANVSANKKSYSGEVFIGGAVGRSRQNTMNDITFTAGTVSFSGNSSSDKYCGGIVGKFENANIVGSSFSGNIKMIIDAVVYEEYIYSGGLVGCVSINANGNYFIHDCRVVRTDIELSGGARKNVGGVLGCIKITPTMNITTIITNCNFDGGNITVKGDAQTVYVGGFLGNSYGGGFNIENCGVFSGTIKVDLKADYFYNVGGFISQIEPSDRLPSSFSKSFSMMDIITKGSCPFSSVAVGGFTAYIQRGDSLEGCYATGNITSIIDGDGNSVIGGLVGNSLGKKITNCYALGNVVVDKSGGIGSQNSVGGLVGQSHSGDNIISNCFSAGKVSAQSATVEVYCGGIIGLNYSDSNIYNTAALGASVTVRGGGTKSAGRLCGSNSGTITNNYALNTMLIEEGAYNSINPATRSAVPGATTRDGKDTDASVFFTQDFWKTTLGFPESIDDVPIWDFSRVAKDGHPRLKNIEGQ